MEQILRMSEVAEILGVVKNTVRNIAARDPSFPQPIRLGVRRVGYRQSELAAWIAAR